MLANGCCGVFFEGIEYADGESFVGQVGDLLAGGPQGVPLKT